MRSASVAEVKAKLSELLQCVEAGETVTITRRGKAVARLVAEQPVKRPVDVGMLRTVAASMPSQAESAGDFMQRVRSANLL